MRKIEKIILHCSATEAHRDVGAKEIDRWHKGRGWRGIGYHYAVRIDGRVETGRAESEIGAHCAGYNATSIGVCYIGGLKNGKPRDTRNDRQKTALRRLVSELLSRYPDATVHGHREFAKKDCPCFDVAKEYCDSPGGGTSR